MLRNFTFVGSTALGLLVIGPWTVLYLNFRKFFRNFVEVSENNFFSAIFPENFRSIPILSENLLKFPERRRKLSGNLRLPYE